MDNQQGQTPIVTPPTDPTPVIEQPAPPPVQVSGPFVSPTIKKRHGLLRLATFILIFGVAGGTWLYFAKAATTTGTWKLEWSDEFNGTSIDSTKWNKYSSTLSYDQACYTTGEGPTANLQEANGTLIIRTKKEATSCGSSKPFSSGYIRSSASGTSSTKYRVSPTSSPSGLIKIEMRAQLPPTGIHGLWPGLWTRNEWDGTDPVTQKATPYGELDLMERWGDEPNNFTYQATTWVGSKHTGGDTGYIDNEKCPVPADNSVVQNNCDDVSAAMHTYGVEIDTAQSQVRYYFDGRLVVTHTANSYPGFDQTFWNNSLKGNWDLRLMNQVVGDPNQGDTLPDSTWKDSQTVIDYVRVYSYDNTAPPPADTTPPTESITTPTANTTISGQYKVTVNASDASGIARVQYFVDNNLQAGVDSTLAPYTFTWNTTTLSNGTHTIGAEAVDKAGNRSARSSVTVAVSNPDTAPPAVTLTTPTESSTVKGTVQVAADATDNKAVTNVQFFLDGVLISGADDNTSPYGYSWDSTKVTNGNHIFGVEAVDAAGNRSLRDSHVVNVQNGDTTKPQPATNVKATADAYNKVSVSWTAATDNVGIQGYILYRDASPIAILNSTTTSYIDSTVSANTKYSYYLVAGDTAGNLSDNSATASVTTPNPADTTAPSAPAGLIASAVSATQVNVSWTASSDNIGVTGYDIYRNGSKLASVDGLTTSFGDSSVSASTKYEYQVKAKDAAGNVSSLSNSALVTTPATVTTGSLTGRVTKAESGDPLGGVYISTYINGQKTVVRSNSQGYYLFGSLPANLYTFKYAVSQQRTPQYINATIVGGKTLTVDVALSKK